MPDPDCAIPPSPLSPTDRPIRVLCVDDNPDICTMLQLVLAAEPDMRWVGTLAAADELVAEVRRHTLMDAPLVVLLDATMPGKNAIDALREVCELFPPVQTILYSGHDDQAFIERAMDAGAWGCISKDEPPPEIVRAIREVAAGRVWWPGLRPTR